MGGGWSGGEKDVIKCLLRRGKSGVGDEETESNVDFFFDGDGDKRWVSLEGKLSFSGEGEYGVMLEIAH